MMTIDKLKTIINDNGGPERVKMFMIMNGNNITYSSEPFTFDDIDDTNETIKFKNSDIRGSEYTVFYDIEQIIGVTMSSVPIDNLVTMYVRG